MYCLVNTFSCYPGGDNPQLVVQDYEIGIRAKVQGSLLLLDLQALGGMQGGRLNGVDKRAIWKREK